MSIAPTEADSEVYRVEDRVEEGVEQQDDSGLGLKEGSLSDAQYESVMYVRWFPYLQKLFDRLHGLKDAVLKSLREVYSSQPNSAENAVVKLQMARKFMRMMRGMVLCSMLTCLPQMILVIIVTRIGGLMQEDGGGFFALTSIMGGLGLAVYAVALLVIPKLKRFDEHWLNEYNMKKIASIQLAFIGGFLATALLLFTGIIPMQESLRVGMVFFGFVLSIGAIVLQAVSTTLTGKFRRLMSTQYSSALEIAQSAVNFFVSIVTLLCVLVAITTNKNAFWPSSSSYLNQTDASTMQQFTTSDYSDVAANSTSSAVRGLDVPILTNFVALVIVYGILLCLILYNISFLRRSVIKDVTGTFGVHKNQLEMHEVTVFPSPEPQEDAASIPSPVRHKMQYDSRIPSPERHRQRAAATAGLVTEDAAQQVEDATTAAQEEQADQEKDDAATSADQGEDDATSPDQQSKDPAQEDQDKDVTAEDKLSPEQASQADVQHEPKPRPVMLSLAIQVFLFALFSVGLTCTSLSCALSCQFKYLGPFYNSFVLPAILIFNQILDILGKKIARRVGEKKFTQTSTQAGSAKNDPAVLRANYHLYIFTVTNIILTSIFVLQMAFATLQYFFPLFFLNYLRGIHGASILSFILLMVASPLNGFCFLHSLNLIVSWLPTSQAHSLPSDHSRGFANRLRNYILLLNSNWYIAAVHFGVALGLFLVLSIFNYIYSSISIALLIPSDQELTPSTPFFTPTTSLSL